MLLLFITLFFAFDGMSASAQTELDTELKISLLQMLSRYEESFMKFGYTKGSCEDGYKMNAQSLPFFGYSMVKHRNGMFRKDALEEYSNYRSQDVIIHVIADIQESALNRSMRKICPNVW